MAQQLRDAAEQVTRARAATQARLLQLHALERAWRQRQADMDAALAPFGPRALYQRLVAAVAEQERLCAALERSFLEHHRHRHHHHEDDHRFRDNDDGAAAAAAAAAAGDDAAGYYGRDDRGVENGGGGGYGEGGDEFGGGGGAARRRRDRDVADFIREYRQAREVWYLRKESKARWDEGRVGGWR